MSLATTPTEQQIATVKTNLSRMIAFNDHVYSYGHTKIEVAFKLLSRTDGKDPGFTFGLNLLESTFRGLGALGGPLGVFSASLLCGVVSDWATTKPKDPHRHLRQPRSTLPEVHARTQSSARPLQ
jgi:hypothetical protein